MAKLIAPLFSFGASGKLGDALVFFPWKGLNVVRSYVVPVNPNTTAQQTQRNYMTLMVAAIRATQARVVHPFIPADYIAYRTLAGTYPTPRTWWNQIIKQGIDQLLVGKDAMVHCEGQTTPTVDGLDVSGSWYNWSANAITDALVYWGTTPTALINSAAAVIVGDTWSYSITGLITGTKYFWQFRPTVHVNYIGTRSGIYSGVAA